MFTKGEWKLDTETGELECDGYILAEIYGASDSQIWDKELHDECVSNAHLIAAAPSMYQALEQLVNYLKHDGYDTNVRLLPFIDYADIALKKARGEQ